MNIELYNELGKLMKVIFNVVDLKVINDKYYIKSEEEGFSVNYHFNCKEAGIKEVRLFYEQVENK